MNEYEASRDVVRAVMPDGAELLIAVRESGGPADRAGRDRQQVFGLAGVQNSIRGAIGLVRGAVQQARPTELTVEFGFDVALESGGLIGVVTGAGGHATFTVTAVWRSDPAEARTTGVLGPTTCEGSPADEEGPTDGTPPA